MKIVLSCNRQNILIEYHAEAAMAAACYRRGMDRWMDVDVVVVVVVVLVVVVVVVVVCRSNCLVYS